MGVIDLRAGAGSPEEPYTSAVRVPADRFEGKGMENRYGRSALEYRPAVARWTCRRCRPRTRHDARDAHGAFRDNSSCRMSVERDR